MIEMSEDKASAVESGPIDVCILSQWFYPTLIGPGERFRRYAPGLRERGVHLRVVSVQQPNMLPTETVDGIPVHRIPVRANPRQVPVVLLRRALGNFRETSQWPDVLQLLKHSPRGGPYVWLARLLGIPCLFVYTMIKSKPKENLGLRQRFKQALSFKLKYQSFNCLVTSSTVMAQNMIEWGVSPERVEVIPNGVDLKRFRPVRSPRERDEIRRQLGIELNDEVILFVGSISQRKGVDTLVAAWPEIAHRRPQARLLLVGPHGDDPTRPPSARDQAFLNRIDQMIMHSPGPERVIFTGEVSNVEDYMRGANLFVFSSKHEGMPNVVPEAMASGLPCILTPFDGLPAEFGEPGHEFLLVPRDPDALAEAMLEVLESQDIRRALSQSARTWVEKHLDVEVSLDRFAQLYRRLAETNRHRMRAK